MKKENEQKIEVTEEYQQILEHLKKNSAAPLFITGKAGTGKSTLIRYLKENFDKNMVIVAPTGVSALNIGGETIHKFFVYPPSIITDECIKEVGKAKQPVFESLNLLVIDEVSMVRSDILDGIDQTLRKNRSSNEPFGGVKVLLVGDLYQLSPVVVRTDAEALSLMGYETPYFFSAKVFKKFPFITKELTKVFRQTDNAFIDILDKIRTNFSVEDVLPILNQRHVSSVSTNSAITLTTRNDKADQINQAHFKKLPGKAFVFTGMLTGRFGLTNEKLPAPLNLALKVGTKVMFTKNGENYLNGTQGEVVEVDIDMISVKTIVKGHETIVNVKESRWEAYTYVFNKYEKRIKTQVIGSYSQFPLMHAWAITIHKAQSKTLEEVKIDLSGGAFAFGQLYVALSRCRSLEKIFLLAPVTSEDVKVDPIIQEFHKRIAKDKI